MQPDSTITAPEHTSTYDRNHSLALSVLRGPDDPSFTADSEPQFRLSIERVLVDRETQTFVGFDGEKGIEAFLLQLHKQWPAFRVVELEGCTTGLGGALLFADGSAVPLAITLDAGGQVICQAGPSTSVTALVSVIETFDREAHLASAAMGCDYELLAEGYNPYVDSPLDVPLVPRTKWTLLSAHLAHQGRYARDVLRCACATNVLIRHRGNGDALASYRLAAVLSPLFSFLTDNVRSFRGAGARRSPRMVRSVMWEEADPTRCCTVPGSLESDFSFETYLAWLEGTQTILFTSDDAEVVSCGKKTTRELMETQEMSRTEIARILRTVYPAARLLEGYLELRSADSLRPRMAGGYLSLVKGLFGSTLSVKSALSILGSIDEDDVAEAALSLRKEGWLARVYGQNVNDLVNQLLQLARASLDDAAERRLLDGIAELWEVHMVPRDAFVHQETKELRGW